jgi:zinc carboxypeptidase
MRIATGLVCLITLLVTALPHGQSGKLPAPDASFGFPPGADFKLATYDQSIDYFRKLDAASKYVTLVEAGRTSQGRPMYFALISSPENLARIDRYREIAQRLAHPASLGETEARRLAAEGRALVHIDGGLHATEVAGPQHAPLLAYDLVRRASEPRMKAILDNVVLILWPTINPDGQQMVAEWYMKNVGTPYEQSELPVLYQEYVGHDNNRDAYMLNMVESRVIEQAWRQWEPQVVYVHHQSGPFPSRIWLPPFSEPVGTDAPPLMSREVNMIGMAIAKGLEEHGQVGATHMGTAFDAWYPGYIDYAPNFKNVAAFWTETALYQYATPHEYTLQDFPQNMRDLRPRSLYSSPWPPGWWRLRDAVDYMETASLSVLEYAAKYKDSLLFNRYKAGRDQIARGTTKPPYAYVIPQDQRDVVAAVELLRRLAFGGIRVSQLIRTTAFDAVTYPPDTWIIPTDQEFAALAREVLDVQKYPDLRPYPGGPPERPYDAAGWTLPLQMGVRVIAVASPLSADARANMKAIGPSTDPKLRPAAYASDRTDRAPFDSVPGAGFDTNGAAASIVPPPGRTSGSGPFLAVDPAQNNAFRALNRAWTAGARVQFAPAGESTSARYIISGLTEADQAALVQSLALAAERTAQAGTAIRRPRIGVYEPWGGNMSAGWTRWILEQYGFDYVTLRPADFHAPLRSRVDVVLLPDGVRLPIAGAGGRGGGRGGRAVRPEYADTLNAEDLAAFEAFIRGGGTLVCVNTASAFAIQQFKLPVTNVVAGLRTDEFFLRGSVVQVSVDPTQAIMAGMPADAAIFADGSPVFDLQDGFKGSVLARYAETGSPLLSGYLIGEKYLAGKAAAVDVKLESGHVVLLGFRPEWRGQPFGTFRVLFNAVLDVH